MLVCIDLRAITGTHLLLAPVLTMWCMVVLQTDACVCGDTVGKGASSTAFAVSSVYFHDVVFKTGVLGQLAVKGNLQSQVHHPGIVQAISLVLPKDSHAHFHQPAWLAMDRHGGSLHQTLTQFPQG